VALYYAPPPPFVGGKQPSAGPGPFQVASGAFSATLSETAATSDAYTETSAAAATLTETAATSDGYTETTASPASLADTAATSDSFTETTNASLAETAATSDAYTETLAATASIGETTATSDLYATGVAIANLYCNLAAWTNQSYSVGNCVSASGNAYRCTTAGTAPTTPSGTSTTPVSFGAGTSQWVWLSAITFSGASADLMFSAAVSGATSSGGLTGSISQPIIWQLWNVNGVTMQTAAVNTAFLTLTGHALTPTNNLTITPALGEGFRDPGIVNALAFNAANGVSFTLPNATGGINYFNITDPNITFDGIQFKDPAATSGCTVLNLNAGANNFHLRNCIIDGTAQAGAQIIDFASGVTGTLFTNSLLIDRQATNANLVSIKDGAASASSATFVNCTFVAINSQSTQFALLSNGTGTTSWLVRNCVSINYLGGMLSATTPAAGEADHCGTNATKVLGAGGTDLGGELLSQTVANMFLSSTADFRLKFGSPFLDTGVTDTTNIPTSDDIFRTARPKGMAWDMGACEYPVPDGSIIYVNSGPIIDNNGDVWTINSANNGEAYKNGSAPVFSNNVYALYWEGGVVYMQNLGNQWYSWSGSAWTGYFGPFFGDNPMFPTLCGRLQIQIWDH